MIGLLKKSVFLLCLLMTFFNFMSCVGPDFTPDFFGFRTQEDQEEEPAPAVEEQPETEEASKVTVYKIVIGSDGRQTEIPIPSGNIMEIGTGTFIAHDETDIGSKFRTSAKFKIVNTSDEPVDLSIPRELGAFSVDSTGNPEATLLPNQSVIITVEFNPKSGVVGGGGKITEEIDIAGFTFELTGIALEPSGVATVNVINDTGSVEISDAGLVTFSSIPLSTHPLRRFFKCEQISCGGELRFTGCAGCIDMLGGSCELLPVNKEGRPVDEVDEMCKPATEDTTPAFEMNLSSKDIMTDKVSKRLIEIINTGSQPLIINSLNISEISNSRSIKQFSLSTNGVFIADSFSEIEQRVLTAFESETNTVPEFPIVIPSYDPPIENSRLFIAIAYHPNDIIGSDGAEAAVGSSAKDEAVLNIEYEDGLKELYLAGVTSVVEIPALQIYVKSSSGLRPVTNGETYPFKGITSNTRDLAAPLFMKLSDSATKTLRISSISLTGDNFEWLDTADKINSKPEESRCSIPVFDETGSQTDFITELQPVSLNPNGFKLEPGAYTMESMPLFGCLNFHRDPAVPMEETIFTAQIQITAQELTAGGSPAVNPDGGIKETTFSFNLLGVIDPIKGKVVLRLVQSMAMILNPQFPTIAAVASKEEMDILIADGRATEQDRDLFITSMVLDPFDEETIYNYDGSVASTPGDGITAVFMPIDTRAVPTTYDDPYLPDYSSLIHDSLLPEGERGIFDKYENVPAGFRSPGLRIYTSTLSYPGPLAPPEERPVEASECEDIDPCTSEGLRKLGEGTTNSAYKGVCTYFYCTAGHYDSDAFHYPTEEPPGERRDMCKDREKRYNLKPITGKYYLNGKMEFENAGLLFQGPTYFHTPYGPLGSDAGPLDEMFHLTFTTEVILPQSDTKDVDRLPDKRIDISKGEYKINLNDPFSELPKLCENNTKNSFIRGEYYSSWRYISSLLKKDKEGKVPAGCPEENNNFTGGIAYLRGKRVDHTTGHATWVAAAKFSSAKNLTFAFKDVMFFMIMNGWFCDPNGPEEDMEGIRCFDKEFNYRDAATQYSIMK